MAMDVGGSKGSLKADINVTPLVDVMLVLLIIFMVTAPLLKAGVPVELPDSRVKALAEEKDQVILSSIHQAKGLEWSVVFIIWCADGMIPLARALNEAGGDEEERRLFYVATTRAKDQLYLCHPLIDYSRGMGMVPLRPSRFIEELEEGTFHPTELPYEQWIIDED